MAENELTPVKEVMPLPEVITSFREDITPVQQWEVIGSPSATLGVGSDLIKGTMTVPLFDDPVSTFVRNRESVKIRIMPPDDRIFDAVVLNPPQRNKYHSHPEVQAHLLAAAEDLRINVATAGLNYDRSSISDGSEKVLGHRLAQAGTPEAYEYALTEVVKLVGTKAADSFISGIRAAKPQWSKALKNMQKALLKHSDLLKATSAELGATTPSRYEYKGEMVQYPVGFDYSIRLADMLNAWSSTSVTAGYEAPSDVREAMRKKLAEEAMNAEDEYEEEDNSDSDSECECGVCEDCESKADGDEGDKPGKPKPGETGPHGKQKPPKVNTKRLPDDFEFQTGETWQFAELKIDENMPLTHEVNGYLHRRKVAHQSGKRVLYPSRLLTDPQKRVFGGKIKVKGGIVVIDISGSMSLTNADIESILTAAPASVILAYSQSARSEANAWLLASRGRRVDPKHIGDIGRSGNGVDGPALVWAINKRKHGEPIFWISDGGVTSAGEGFSEQLLVDCVTLVKKHKIICYPDVPTAVKAFKRGVHRSVYHPNIQNILMTGRARGLR